MKVTKAALPGLLILEPKVFRDARGYFVESYNERTLAEVGIRDRFVQDNHSYSTRNVVRGLHYQLRPQAKFVGVAIGEILDVTVDLRRSSPTFGQWCAINLSEVNQQMLWIPAGFAHGFRVLSEAAHVLYKVTDFYDPEVERTIAWNDPDLKIDWQITHPPTISAKDTVGICFAQAEVFA